MSESDDLDEKEIRSQQLLYCIIKFLTIINNFIVTFQSENYRRIKFQNIYIFFILGSSLVTMCCKIFLVG